ncbi:MAG TPA: TonB-dependent receptor [Blastocatellia bacterium]|nr:TonB-dependent receptor [Blastocatellia bacterium]
MRTRVALINRGVIVALKNCGLALVCCALAAAITQAQSIGGNINGTVADQQGAVIRKATVTATNEGTGAVRTASSDENGYYILPELPVGTYALKVEGGGFVATTLSRVKVDIGAETRVNVTLSLQAKEAEVNISAEAPLLQQDSSALFEVIDNKQVNDLPVNGRDFRRLTTLASGSAPRSQNGSLGSYTVNGQREKSNIFLIDGVDNNDSFRNQPSFNQGGATNAPATIFPIDALAEFNSQTQGAAEYGRNSGAVVNIAIKSGTNQFHGTAYDFLRNDNLDARNFFERCATPGCPDGGRQEFRNNNFGGVIGGPIIKNQTFFFFAYEGQREFVNSPGLVRVPSPEDIINAQNVNAARGILTSSQLGLNILNQFPKVAAGGPASGNNFAFAAPNRNDSDNIVAKVNHKISDRFELSGRYIFGDGVQNFPLTSGNGSNLAPYQTVIPTRIQLFGLNLTQVLSSRLINESRAGYNRYIQFFAPLDANFNPASIGINTGLTTGGLPNIGVTGFVSLGAPTNVPRGRISSAYQFTDNLTFSAGAHTYKFGGEYRRAIINSSNDVNVRSRLVFNNLADLLAGMLSPNGSTILRGGTRRDTFTNNFGFFAQDDWKITPRLTLNYGLRYEYLGQFKDEGDRLFNFVPGSTTGLVQVGTQGLSNLYQTDRNNFGPRIGFAYDVTGKGKTIARGSYGIYYDTPSQDFFLLQNFNTGGPASPATNPGSGVVNLTFSGITQIQAGVPIFGAAVAPSSSAPSPIFAVDTNLRTPYVQNYNLNVQQEVIPGMVAQVGYVGAVGRKLFRIRDINQATPGPAATRQLRRPFNSQYPQFSFINFLETSSNANYHALQASLKQRLSRGLNFGVTYSYSKSIDDASNGIFSGPRGVVYPQDSFNIAGDRAVSVFDQKHRFMSNFTYDLDFLPGLLGGLPKSLTGGWQVAGIYTGASGLPITPFFGNDISGTGELNDRPNVIADLFVAGPVAANPDPRCQRTVSQGGRAADTVRDAASWFNACAFSAPSAGMFGTAGRNSIIGPRLHIVDMSVGKTTKINDRFTAQIRAEAFNLFNRSNLALPNAQFDSGGFTTITQTLDVQQNNPRLLDGGPRVIQFGLKLVF